jgi:transposase InsO family protein
MSNAIQPPRRMRFSFESRCRIVQLVLAGESPQAAAAACGASRATGYRLWRRYQEGGWSALVDRPSTPKRQPRGGCQPSSSRRSLRGGSTCAQGRWCWPLCSSGRPRRSARCCVGSAARACREPTVTRLSVTSVAAPASCCMSIPRSSAASTWPGSESTATARSAAAAPAGRYLHIAIDDHSRLAYAELLTGEDRYACAAFLRRHRPVRRAGNHDRTRPAKAYHSHRWIETCAEPGIQRRYTRPYSPWTNEKAEALIKTLLREWAYRYTHSTSEHRSRALNGFLRWYNRRRPHGSLGGRPPISRVSHLCGHYI